MPFDISALQRIATSPKRADGQGGVRVWHYTRNETPSELLAAGYFTNARRFDMAVGDVVYHFNPVTQLLAPYVVTTVSNGSASVGSITFVSANAQNEVNVISGTTYTLQPTDNNKILRFTNIAGCVVGLPPDMAVGFAVTWIQRGIGQITFQPVTGAHLDNREGHNKSYALHSAGGLFVDHNPGGGSAAWVLSGDTGV